MKWGDGGITGELHQDVGSSQRRDVARECHPDQPNDVDQGAEEDVGAAAAPGCEASACFVTEHAE